MWWVTKLYWSTFKCFEFILPQFCQCSTILKQLRQLLTWKTELFLAVLLRDPVSSQLLMEQKAVWAVTSLFSILQGLSLQCHEAQKKHCTIFTHHTLSISSYFEMLKKKKRFWEEREKKQEGAVTAVFLSG